MFIVLRIIIRSFLVFFLISCSPEKNISTKSENIDLSEVVQTYAEIVYASYVDSHSSSLHTGGSALSGIGAQLTEQCRCAATPEELVDRLLLPRSRAAVSLACEAVRVAALAILSFLPKGITLPLRFQQSSHGMILLLLRILF